MRLRSPWLLSLTDWYLTLTYNTRIIVVLQIKRITPLWILVSHLKQKRRYNSFWTSIMSSIQKPLSIVLTVIFPKATPSTSFVQEVWCSLPTLLYNRKSKCVRPYLDKNESILSTSNIDFSQLNHPTYFLRFYPERDISLLRSRMDKP